MKKLPILEDTFASRRLLGVGRFVAASSILGLVAYVGFTMQASSLTVGCIYLLLVVTVAVYAGFWEASAISLLAVALIDYFFVPPIFGFEIAEARDWVALAAFEVAAIVVSRVSSNEMKSARDAAMGHIAMAHLYELSRNSLLMDLREAPGPQLVILIQRIFATDAVALFDMNLGRQDRAGEWGLSEADIAKECFLSGSVQDVPEENLSQRILMVGQGPVGALVVRGKMDALVVDALASLAAIAIDRHQWIEKEERAEEKSKEERLRAAVMDALAHEFKTPLTAVQTASSGLLEIGSLDGLQHGLVTLINEQVIRLNGLCTKLLLTAKLEAGTLGLQTEEVNVQEMISEVLASSSMSLDRDRIQVAIENPELTVSVDRGLFAMIISQYVDNARKYSPQGTPIEIAARSSRNEAIISVHNIGSTIRIEDRERVFDRFYRSSDQKDTVSGTGIGLSVARKAAEAHHGHVWVISDDNNGTEFFLSLPTNARRMP
jgi:two-component system sensor histidine kinase KdpD